MYVTKEENKKHKPSLSQDHRSNSRRSNEIIDARATPVTMPTISEKTSQRSVMQLIGVAIGMDLDADLSGNKIQTLKNLLCQTYGGRNLSHGAHGSSKDQQFSVRAIINDYLDARADNVRAQAEAQINTAWGVTEFS